MKQEKENIYKEFANADVVAALLKKEQEVEYFTIFDIADISNFLEIAKPIIEGRQDSTEQKKARVNIYTYYEHLMGWYFTLGFVHTLNRSVKMYFLECDEDGNELGEDCVALVDQEKGVFESAVNNPVLGASLFFSTVLTITKIFEGIKHLKVETLVAPNKG